MFGVPPLDISAPAAPRRPRKIFIISGVVALLAAGLIMYVQFRGEGGSPSDDELLTLPALYPEVSQRMTQGIAALRSFHAAGVISVKLDGQQGLAGFSAETTGEVNAADETVLAMEWRSNVGLFTVNGERYAFLAELARGAPDSFFVKISRADVPAFIRSLIEPLLNRWIIVGKKLIARAAAEDGGGDAGFNERQFLTELRPALARHPTLIRLVRKFSEEEHYQFIIHPDNGARFLADLFGTLSQKSFAEDELAGLTQYLSEYRINGELWINEQGLPSRLLLNWNNWLTADLTFSAFNQPTALTPPTGAVPLENLLQ